ncbi:MAG: helix-turn-helix transcriptional regulator [Firmicutes bacterium]|nr:helix-turn-helix transcriptional regulator [Bacillota bacterium]
MRVVALQHNPASPRAGRRLAAPVCQVESINEMLVEQLRPGADRAAAAAPLFKAVADDARARIVWALSRAELCVCDVAALIGTSVAAASYHLRLLHRLGAVQYRRDGKMVYYRLADPRLGRIVEAAAGLSTGPPVANAANPPARSSPERARAKAVTIR